MLACSLLCRSATRMPESRKCDAPGMRLSTWLTWRAEERAAGRDQFLGGAPTYLVKHHSPMEYLLGGGTNLPGRTRPYWVGAHTSVALANVGLRPFVDSFEQPSISNEITFYGLGHLLANLNRAAASSGPVAVEAQPVCGRLLFAADRLVPGACQESQARVSQFTCCSKAWATRSTVASSKVLPTSISPTGSPLTLPHGMLRAGWPVKLKGAVLSSIFQP